MITNICKKSANDKIEIFEKIRTEPSQKVGFEMVLQNSETVISKQIVNKNKIYFGCKNFITNSGISFYFENTVLS